MTSPGTKLPSPGRVPMPDSPASSRSPNRDDILNCSYGGVNKRVETRDECLFGGRLRYNSPPKSLVLKKIKIETSDNDTVWSGRVVLESPVITTGIKMEIGDHDFTPRCTMQRRTFKQEHSCALSFDTQDWESLAAMLSPPQKILPSTSNHNILPPNPLPHNHVDVIESPKNAHTRCFCISCAGPAKAKPQVAACAVCATQIPYSVCVASDRKPTTPTTVPTMCFACVNAFV
jgi:hypothetical protein